MPACSAARHARRWIDALALLLGLVAVPASADWKQDYARGLEAARDGRWSDTARYMQSALADNPEPAARVRLYGQRFEVYAPQYYAGLAAYRQGDCASALRYWSQPASQSLIGGIAELSSQQQAGRRDCEQRTASNSKPPASSSTASTGTSAPSSAPSSAPAPATTTLPSGPAVATTTPPAPTPTAPERPKPAPTTPTAPPVSNPVASTPAPAATSSPGDALRPLLKAYLDGRYAEVLRLSARPPSDARLRWHVLALRSAAAFNLAQSGQPPDDALDIARSAATDAARDAAGRQPDPAFYSPKFIRFFLERR